MKCLSSTLIAPWLLVFLLVNASIWPQPKEFTTGTSPLWIQPNVLFTYNPSKNVSISSLGDISSETIVHDGIRRTLEKIFNNNIVPWKLYPRNTLEKFEPEPTLTSRIYIRNVTIIQTSSDNAKTFRSQAGDVDESYTITISEDGSAEISAATTYGILHALKSFAQLFYQHSSGTGVYTNQAPIKIVDAPKFPYRGLNLDVARSWYPVREVLKTIDALADNKFNRLHLHMTDSQSWPMEIPSLPELAQRGAYTSHLVYSPKDIRDIQSYGIQRGVQVIIEIDMPGHTASIAHAYPDLITGFMAKPWTTYCAEPPCGSLKLNSAAVDLFVDKLFADILPRISPFSAYMHTGGDEVNLEVYNLDDTVNSNDKAKIQPLIQRLVDRVHNQLRAADVTPIVWEEMALDWNLTLGSDVVVQTWLSDASVASVTEKGHKALSGNYNYWYLDCGEGQWLNINNGKQFEQRFPFTDYCSPTKNWRLIYSHDPLSGVPPERQHLVLGGEVHVWSEQIDPINLETMLWPRASAAGEVLWSGRQDESGQNRSQVTAGPRLAEWRERMVERGFFASPVQMIHCTQLGGEECSL
ncbi:Beta-hexosaminidase [Podosphaera aphanis]|nr:Beta-hexosaminidase [Podosphaera aphanis]